MKQLALGVLGIVAACAACSGGSNEPTGSTTGATGGSGGSSSSSTSSTGGGGSGGTGAGCSASPDNVYDNSAESGLPACAHPVAPLPTEDGTFAITVFGPFPKAFSVEGFTFMAAENAQKNLGVTDPWTATVVVVPAGEDPLAVDPAAAAQPFALVPLESLPDGGGTYHRFSVKLGAALPVGACDSVVVALRNTVATTVSALAMCGAGSSHPETNQWWNLDGTMSEMVSYGSDFDRDWAVSLLPAAP